MTLHERKSILVTGAAGFIGSHLVARLLKEGTWQITGLDNLSDYYDVTLKHARLAHLHTLPGAAAHFRFERLDLTERPALVHLFEQTQPSVVVHLAAQAGVRYGLQNPVAYLESNLIGHFNLLEACRTASVATAPAQTGGTAAHVVGSSSVEHLLYASSSSVYGANEKVPFAESDDVSRPLSLYAATKRSDELLTHSWSHQFGLPATGLRFFTVYGPWGRPDMSPMIFANSLLSNKKIPLFNGGDLWRDFTYVDDIIEAIIRLIPHRPTREQYGGTPHTLFNLGNQHPVRMTDFVEKLADVLKVQALIEPREWPPTEVYRTFADTSHLQKAVGWAPATPLPQGLQRFAEWYRPWHGKIMV